MSDLSRHGRATINAGSKSFALASRMLEPGVRDDATMLYAYCRFADDLVDGQLMGHGQIADYKTGQGERVTQLRHDTQKALHGEPVDEPHYASLAAVVARHDLPQTYVMQLIDGFRMDADDREYESLDDTLDYGYHVAGVVGVMMAWLMGVRDPATLDRASDLGIAFQLTNIARDVIDDARAGRIFVPKEMLLRHQAPTTAKVLSNPANWPAAHAAALDLLDEAEPYYDSAHAGIAQLSRRNAWAILTALKVYREIGERLRNGGPEAWQSRVSTSKASKLGLAAQAYLGSLSRKSARQTPRGDLYARPLT